jgi:hypothetical protein
VSVLARLIRAREAFQDGELELHAQILEDLERELGVRARTLCPCCGLSFEWHGLLQRHEDVSGHRAGECP